VQGIVVIDALVDAKGNVTAVKLIAGSAMLQGAAMDAVRNWRYEPARLNGEAIPTHTKVSVTFNLH